MKANWITGLFGAAVVAALALWLAIEHKGQMRLVKEHGELQQQMSQLLALSARNQELSNFLAQPVPTRSLSENETRELLRLRGQIGVLRRQAGELESVRSENRQAHASLQTGRSRGNATADFWPRDSWGFAGYASPDASLQTSIWAADNGDLKVLLAGTTGEMRKMMEKDLAGKSEDEASVFAMDQVINLNSVRVLSREVQADDTIVLTAAFEERAGTNTSKLLLKKIGDDWKLSGPAD